MYISKRVFVRSRWIEMRNRIEGNCGGRDGGWGECVKGLVG